MFTIVVVMISEATLRPSAQAQPEKPALHWARGVSAEKCIDPRTLAQRVEAITGPTLVSAARAELTIEAHVDGGPGSGFTLHLRVRHVRTGNQGDRVLEFQTSDCRALDETFAFLIAMAIDPDLGSEGIPPELSWVDEQRLPEQELLATRSVVAEKRTPPVPEPALARPRLSAQPANSALWQLHAAVGFGNDPSSRPALGLALTLSRRFLPQLALAAQLSATTPLGRRMVETRSGARSLSIERLGVAVLGCALWPTRPNFEARACLGPELTGMFGHGSGFTEDAITLIAAVSGQLRIDLSLRMSARWSIVGSASLQLASTKSAIRYQYAGRLYPLFHTQRVIGLGWIGLGHDF